MPLHAKEVIIVNGNDNLLSELAISSYQEILQNSLVVDIGKGLFLLTMDQKRRVMKTVEIQAVETSRK